jgi:VIT1/CCC1 family predicted Fe2+/Mn2+ transporter
MRCGAAVHGANDGLCSNLSLVMGVAGAAPSGRTVGLAGIAGLVAGACSMALGEWISVTSARELAEREVATEREELEMTLEDEREELQLIYEAKGLSTPEAEQLSHELLARPRTALEVLTREELGIDPDELSGSPWTAAGASFLLFAIGAVIPVLPFGFAHGWIRKRAPISARYGLEGYRAWRFRDRRSPRSSRFIPWRLARVRSTATFGKAPLGFCGC